MTKFCEHRDVEAMLAEIEKDEAARAKDMPTEVDALRQIRRAVERLKDLGFRDAVYCPKDGTLFDCVEAGSTRIFTASYEGKWPNGSWWIHGDGDMFPSRPILYRPKASDNQDKE